MSKNIENDMLRWVINKATALGVYARYGAMRARQSLRQRQMRHQLDAAGDALTFHLNASVGLFAHLSWCLQIAAYCEKAGISPRFVATSKQYGDRGEDWFARLFEQPLAPAKSNCVLTVRHFEELPFYRDKLLFDLGQASYLQKRYFPVASSILRRVDSFQQAHFVPGRTIGCHFRGTDKGVEAKRVAYETMVDCVRRALGGSTGATVFVAADEANFPEYLQSAVPEATVVCAPAFRSGNGQAVHLDPNQFGRARGEEALVDCLLLSRCDVLIKCPSALSAWSAVFNPQVELTLVGRPFDHVMFFPESILVQEGASVIPG